MKSVKIATLKDELSAHVRAVEHGASYLVTDRNRPVAQLIPLPAANDDGCTVVPASKPFAVARTRKFKATRKVFDSLTLLQEERGTR
jgi:prevent-host-death family protein